MGFTWWAGRAHNAKFHSLLLLRELLRHQAQQATCLPSTLLLGAQESAFFFFFFFLFRAAPVAYGSSQARGRISATAAGLQHSHRDARSKPHPRPMPHLIATGILNPLSEARD